MALRPQLLGMACFALVLLARRPIAATHPRRLWLVPLVVAIWANLHGSFFLGPLVLGLAWLEDLHDRVRAAASDARRRASSARRRLPHAVRTGGLGLRGRAVDEPGGHRPDHRVAADVAPDGAGLLFFASALAVVALIARRGRAIVVADARLARRLLRDRRVRRARAWRGGRSRAVVAGRRALLDPVGGRRGRETRR